MSMLDDVFDNSGKNEQLNERPYSRSRESMDDLKGKVKGMFGSGQVEQGAAETGRLANKLWAEFKRAVGQKYGSAQKAVSYADVKSFFELNDLDTSGLGTNPRMTFTPKDVGQAILAASRKQMSTLAPEEKKQQPVRATQQSTEQPQQQSQQSQEEKSQPSSEEKQQALSPLKGQLSSLSSEDRQKLLRMLS